MDNELDLNIIFDQGVTFFKLIECLKNSENAVLEFTASTIKYNELVNKQADNKKSYLTINNSFEIYPSKLEKYYYGMKEPEYPMYFNVKDLKDKLKDAKGKDKIRLYKPKHEDLIYLLTIKPDNTVISVSFFKPLNMMNQDFITYSKPSREDDNPNCTVNPKTLKENCTKIKPTNYKKVTLDCYATHMIAEVFAPDGSNGLIFAYGEKPSINTSINIGKIDIDFNHLYSQDLMMKPIKVNIITNNHLKINIPTNAFKSLGKLAPLSSNHIKFFFEDGYVKILTCIKDFGHIRTYIGNDVTA